MLLIPFLGILKIQRKLVMFLFDLVFFEVENCTNGFLLL